jgi:hypothetical protein
VELSREAIEKIACWIDFAIPFYGKYVSDGDHASVAVWEEQEQTNIQEYIDDRQSGIAGGFHRSAPGSDNLQRVGRPNITVGYSRLSFSIFDGPAEVKIQIIDSRGRSIRNLVRKQFPTGRHSVPFLTRESPIPVGCYFLSVRIGDRRVAIPHVLGVQ